MTEEEEEVAERIRDILEAYLSGDSNYVDTVNKLVQLTEEEYQ